MRHEFTKPVKKAALERSGGRCEAVGPRYGYQPGERCGRNVAPGRVHFDHYPRGAHDPSPETRTLGNCLATCPECNMFANRTEDTPREAQIKRVRYADQLHDAKMQRKAGLDVADPVRPRPRKREPPKIKSRGFQQQHRPFPQRQR